MKATDLMVGDFVFIANTSTKISESDLALVLGFKDKDFHIDPIPLTAEILEKNGFTGGEYKSYTGDVWYLEEEEGFRKIGLTMSRKESTLWGEKIKPLCPDSIGHNFAVPNIKYVHELQHALKLCGIDKEIEL